MHPHVFLENFWRNDLRDEIFVAMSFDEKYHDRWASIFVPAIEEQPLDGRTIKAVRVDIRKSGDSILSEITNGIAHAQLILADISVLDETQDLREKHRYRNGNVMYEVGLAIACRQPVEVILLRDDSYPLLFDLSHIPVLQINPADVPGTIVRIRGAMVDRFAERKLEQDFRFVSTFQSLTQFEINLIRLNAHLEYFGWKGPSYSAGVAMALPRILDKKILRLLQVGTDGKPDIYGWTAFGKAIATHLKGKNDSTT